MFYNPIFLEALFSFNVYSLLFGRTFLLIYFVCHILLVSCLLVLFISNIPIRSLIDFSTQTFPLISRTPTYLSELCITATIKSMFAVCIMMKFSEMTALLF